MEILEREEFKERNKFGFGQENVDYAKFFIGKSYLKPLVDKNSPIFMANVTFEPRCRNKWHKRCLP